ncbi:MAG: hypothetical protein HN465_08435, partial [Nitrospina sp.]|nr:hypothetical protein [Nitrospina sp.]
MDEESGTNKSKQDTEVENKDAKAIKELLSVASHERKNLQLLVEYFEKKIPELDERKQFFDRISSQVPDSLQKLDFVSHQIEEIKNFDARIRDFQRVAKDIESNHSTLRRDLGELHQLSDHVEQKIKSLQQQRSLVEKANEDAGRLNILVWDMDSKIKKMGEESKLIKSADRNINRLENMLESMETQVTEITGFREMMKVANERVKEMKSTCRELDHRYASIVQEKSIVENYTQDTEEMKITLNKLQGDYEKVLGQGHIIEDARITLTHMTNEISSLKIESKNISVKNEMIRSISSKLRDLDSLSIDVDTKISKIREDSVIIDKTEEKVNKLNIFIVNNLSNKMKLLKEEMKSIDVANDKMSRFNIVAEEAEQRVQGLDEEIKKIET